MNIFQSQMLKDMNHYKSTREENKQKEVEAITGQKFPDLLKQQAGYPQEKIK